jgi:hypothetical protein
LLLIAGLFIAYGATDQGTWKRKNAEWKTHFTLAESNIQAIGWGIHALWGIGENPAFS